MTKTCNSSSKESVKWSRSKCVLVIYFSLIKKQSNCCSEIRN